MCKTVDSWELVCNTGQVPSHPILYVHPIALLVRMVSKYVPTFAKLLQNQISSGFIVWKAKDCDHILLACIQDKRLHTNTTSVSGQLDPLYCRIATIAKIWYLESKLCVWLMQHKRQILFVAYLSRA